jgi:hypothetical protein
MSNSIPIIHRIPFLLLQLDPQVTFTSTSGEQSPFHHWAGSRLDVGGGTQLKNDILVDGTPNTWGPKTNYVPTIDSVSELNVQQNATDAEYGHSAGGIISVQMKSGSNDWHGSAYFFGRNPLLNARPDSTTPTPSLVRHNVWGVTSGNPIIKNKVFNFFSYKGQNLREPVNIIRTLPTAAEREGDFSKTMFLNGTQSGMKPIYDPWTTQTNGSTINRTPYAGNIIPKSQQDPTALLFLKDVWAPNLPGDDLTGVNNYRLTIARVYDYYNYTNRTDWNINDKWKIFGRISRFHTNVVSPNPPGTPAGSTGGSERNTLTVAGDAVGRPTRLPWWIFAALANKPAGPLYRRRGGNSGFESVLAQQPHVVRRLRQSAARALLSRPPTGRQSRPRQLLVFGSGLLELARQDRQDHGQALHKNGRRIPALPRQLVSAGSAAVLLSGNEYVQYLRESERTAERASVGHVPERRDGRYLESAQRSRAVWTESFLRLLLSRRFQNQQEPDAQSRTALGVRHAAGGSRRPPVARDLDLTNPIPEFQARTLPRCRAPVLAVPWIAAPYTGAWIHTDSNHPAPTIHRRTRSCPGSASPIA